MIRRIRRPIQLFDSTGMSEELRRSLNLIILAVMFSMVCVNITSGAAWTGYLRALGADEFALGIIAAIPVTASTVQIVASYILERTGKRRELFLYFGIFSRMVWVVMALIPYFVPMEAVALRMFMVMVLLALTASSGAFINVGFFSLVADLVPMRIRGRYFSTRSAVSLTTGILTGLLVSFLMDRVNGYIGYTIVFIIAGIFGTLDILCFFRVQWPAMQKPKENRQSLFSMIREVLQNKSFRRIVLTFTCWAFAVNIAAPFYNVYMLEQIGMSYTEITLLNQVLPNVTTVLVIGWWGRRMDEYGNKPVIQLTGLYCMLAAFFWVFTGYRAFFILPFVNAFSGMLGPAFDLGTQNLYLSHAPERNRSMYVAVFFACTQLFGNALSNALGGYLVQNVLPSLEALNLSLLGFRQTRYHFIFMISSILRTLTVLVLLPRLVDLESKTVRELAGDILLGFRNKIVFTMRNLHVYIVRKRVYRRRKRREALQQQAAQPDPQTDQSVPDSAPSQSERENEGGTSDGTDPDDRA